MHDGERPIQVLRVRDADVHYGPGPPSSLITDHLDLTVRNDVQRPVQISQHHDSQRHLLNGASLPGSLDDVAHGELILQQEEEAGDDVPDQALRSEGDGQAEDTGTSKDWRNVDEGVKREQDCDGDDRDPSYTPKQLRDGSAPLLAQRRDRVVAIV